MKIIQKQFFFILLILNFNFADAISGSVNVSQVVNNSTITVSTTTPSESPKEPITYTAGIAFAGGISTLPVDFTAPIVFIIQNSATTTTFPIDQIPEGYFVPKKNQFIITNNPNPANRDNISNNNTGDKADLPERDICVNVIGLQTSVPLGWISNDIGECFKVIQYAELKREIISFDFVPEKFTYPVNSPFLVKAINLFSIESSDSKFLINNSTKENTEIDLIGAILYLGITWSLLIFTLVRIFKFVLFFNK